jgi:hypothetical protein
MSDLRQAVARIIDPEAWTSSQEPGRLGDRWRKALAKADTIIPLIEAAVVERCAGIAEQLGGDRVVTPTRPPSDRESRYDWAIHGQHVRAQSIAAAIRASNGDKR